MTWTRHILYATTAAMVFATILYSMICMIRLIGKREKQQLGQCVAEFSLTGYLIMLACLTLTNPYGSFGLIGVNANMQVFKAFVDAYRDADSMVLTQFFLNILLFVPFGMLLPMVFKEKMEHWKNVAYIVLSTSCFIETVQFFIGRTSDIDDVLTNFLGGMIGYLAWKSVKEATEPHGELIRAAVR